MGTSMEIMEIIKTRRSIRKYTALQVSDSLITSILEAGRWAPSGLNNQPWRFMVIRDTDMKKGLSRFTKYGSIIKESSAIIMVFIDRLSIYDRDKDIMSVGACIQNMLLEAHSLGLGTCWLGEILNRKTEVNRYLKIKKQYELMAVISLGYKGKPPSKTNRKSLASLLLKRSYHD